MKRFSRWLALLAGFGGCCLFLFMADIANAQCGSRQSSQTVLQQAAIPTPIVASQSVQTASTLPAPQQFQVRQQSNSCSACNQQIQQSNALARFTLPTPPQTYASQSYQSGTAVNQNLEATATCESGQCQQQTVQAPQLP